MGRNPSCPQCKGRGKKIKIDLNSSCAPIYYCVGSCTQGIYIDSNGQKRNVSETARTITQIPLSFWVFSTESGLKNSYFWPLEDFHVIKKIIQEEKPIVCHKCGQPTCADIGSVGRGDRIVFQCTGNCLQTIFDENPEEFEIDPNNLPYNFILTDNFQPQEVGWSIRAACK